MKRVYLLLSLFVLLLAILFFYYRFEKEFSPPAHDEIQVGYQVSDESIKIQDERDTLSKKMPFQVVVNYAKMVERSSDTSAILEIKNVETGDVAFTDQWQETRGLSGKVLEIDPKDWGKGRYKAVLVRNEEQVAVKKIRITD